MLVLSRKLYDRVRLKVPDGKGGYIVIWVGVADIQKGKIRLGIEAPDEVEITREELIPRSDHGPST